MIRECVICKSSFTKVVFKEFEIDILRCTRCGHVFSSFERSQDYNGYFGSEAVKPSADYFWQVDAHAAMYDDFGRRFLAGKEGRLLDFGCGLGFFLKRFAPLKKWEMRGCEISRSAVDFARDNFGLCDIFCGKIKDAPYQKESFDIITLWDVIEHIPYPDDIIFDLKAFLKPGGFIFLHTPNIDITLLAARLTKLCRGMKAGLHYLEARDHLNHYSVKTITTLLSRNTFSGIEFTYLKPIRSIAGSKSRVLAGVKDAYAAMASIVFLLSAGRVNLNNLFVIARK
jgi:2-polyprenyl-3-methyl-5-hydroxy-6-metoxy-1,4-benzoquinol methylase